MRPSGQLAPASSCRQRIEISPVPRQALFVGGYQPIVVGIGRGINDAAGGLGVVPGDRLLDAIAESARWR